MTTTTKVETCTSELHGADGGHCPGCGLDVYAVYGVPAPAVIDPLAICEWCHGPTAGPLDACTEPACLALDIEREAQFKRLEDQ